MSQKGGGKRKASKGVVYAREVSTPELLERDRSDSDDSETDESRPKFANPEGIYILILNVEVSYGTQFAINVIGDKRNNIIFTSVSEPDKSNRRHYILSP